MAFSKRRIITAVFFVVLLAGIGGGSFYYGIKYGEKIPKTLLISEVKNIEKGKPALVDFGLFWQTWNEIENNYLKNKDVSAEKKVYGAIKGLVNSLDDPYSVFFPPADSKKFYEDIQGSFGGIGAELGIIKNKLVVVAPLKNTPADKAGLKPGDHIFKINSTSTDGLTLDEAISLIRGPEGTEVVLSILREGWDKPKEFPILRATIVVPTLDFEMKDGNIAYIKLYSFNNNTNQLFFEAAVKALRQGAKGVVLDLRNNPGGYFGVAIDMAGWFLPRGTLIVKEVSRIRPEQKFLAQGNQAFADFPVVVLINEGSASASEILAGTLRDNRNIKLVGAKTFGKGTVQELIEIGNGASLKITTANWVLPSGLVLEGEGLKPDFEVKMPDSENGKKPESDPQLDKALEIIKEEINKQPSGLKIFGL